MKRQRPPAHEEWRAVRNPRGQWTIVDATGSSPFQSPDPLRRYTAVRIGAQAPRLQVAVAWLLQDLHAQELERPHIRHRVRMQFAEVVLIDSRPEFGELMALLRGPRALELPLDLEEAA